MKREETEMSLDNRLSWNLKGIKQSVWIHSHCLYDKSLSLWQTSVSMTNPHPQPFRSGSLSEPTLKFFQLLGLCPSRLLCLWVVEVNLPWVRLVLLPWTIREHQLKPEVCYKWTYIYNYFQSTIENTGSMSISIYR